jgi:hypothetical protein
MVPSIGSKIAPIGHFALRLLCRVPASECALLQVVIANSGVAPDVAANGGIDRRVAHNLALRRGDLEACHAE